MTVFTKKSRTAKTNNLTSDSKELRNMNHSILKELVEEVSKIETDKKIITTKKGAFDTRTVMMMAAQGMNKKLIAHTLGYTERGFNILIKENPEIDEALNKGNSVIGSKLIQIAFEKIENGEDKNHGLLKLLMQEFSHIGNKTEINIKHENINTDNKKENTEEERLKIADKIFKSAEEHEDKNRIIEANYTEVKEE